MVPIWRTWLAEQLPISFDLMAPLPRWQDLFGECENQDRRGHRWMPEQDRAWSHEGLAIGVETRRELPGWTVASHDGWRAVLADGRADGPLDGLSDRPAETPELGPHRAFFGYEVTDEVMRPRQRPVACGPGLQRPDA